MTDGSPDFGDDGIRKEVVHVIDRGPVLLPSTWSEGAQSPGNHFWVDMIRLASVDGMRKRFGSEEDERRNRGDLTISS